MHDVRLEACTFTKMNLLVVIFHVFWRQFHLATVRTAIFKYTSFSQNIFNGCFRYTLFSCSMIQEILRELMKQLISYMVDVIICTYIHN